MCVSYWHIFIICNIVAISSCDSDKEYEKTKTYKHISGYTNIITNMLKDNKSVCEIIEYLATQNIPIEQIAPSDQDYLNNNISITPTTIKILSASAKEWIKNNLKINVSKVPNPENPSNEVNNVCHTTEIVEKINNYTNNIRNQITIRHKALRERETLPAIFVDLLDLTVMIKSLIEDKELEHEQQRQYIIDHVINNLNVLVVDNLIDVKYMRELTGTPLDPTDKYIIPNEMGKQVLMTLFQTSQQPTPPGGNPPAPPTPPRKPASEPKQQNPALSKNRYEVFKNSVDAIIAFWTSKFFAIPIKNKMELDILLMCYYFDIFYTENFATININLQSKIHFKSILNSLSLLITNFLIKNCVRQVEIDDQDQYIFIQPQEYAFYDDSVSVGYVDCRLMGILIGIINTAFKSYEIGSSIKENNMCICIDSMHNDGKCYDQIISALLIQIGYNYITRTLKGIPSSTPISNIAMINYCNYENHIYINNNGILEIRESEDIGSGGNFYSQQGDDFIFNCFFTINIFAKPSQDSRIGDILLFDKYSNIVGAVNTNANLDDLTSKNPNAIISRRIYDHIYKTNTLSGSGPYRTSRNTFVDSIKNEKSFYKNLYEFYIKQNDTDIADASTIINQLDTLITTNYSDVNSFAEQQKFLKYFLGFINIIIFMKQ